MEKELTDKCPACGKFVGEDDGFYTRECPMNDGSYMVVCCNKKCADTYVARVIVKDGGRLCQDCRGEGCEECAHSGYLPKDS